MKDAHSKNEATPIARLLGGDRNQTIGWVYLWNTRELSILWIDRNFDAKAIEPPLSPETLADAKTVTSDTFTDLLETLSAADQSSSG